jgi:hypothetical protein
LALGHNLNVKTVVANGRLLAVSGAGLNERNGRFDLRKGQSLNLKISFAYESQ